LVFARPARGSVIDCEEAVADAYDIARGQRGGLDPSAVHVRAIAAALVANRHATSRGDEGGVKSRELAVFDRNVDVGPAEPHLAFDGEAAADQPRDRTVEDRRRPLERSGDRRFMPIRGADGRIPPTTSQAERA